MKGAGGFNLIIMIFFLLIIYFVMIRPQRKRDKEVAAMRSALKPGDDVVTIGGIIGRVVKVNEDTVVVQVGSEKVKVEFLKTAIGSVATGKQGKQSSAPKETPSKKEKAEETASPVNRDKKIKPKKLTPKKEEVDETEDK